MTNQGSTSTIAQSFASLNALFERIPYWAVALFARVIVGLVFWKSGQTKIDGFSIQEKTFALFRDIYKVPIIPPDVAAYMATFAELTCPILLWLGLLSRIGALALLCMTAVIQTFVFPAAYVTHGLWAIALLMIVSRGPGCVSLDHWLGLDKGRCK